MPAGSGEIAGKFVVTKWVLTAVGALWHTALDPPDMVAEETLPGVSSSLVGE